MKLHKPLDDLLDGSGSLRGLRVLSRSDGEEFTASDLVRRSGLAPSQAWSLLHKLHVQGIASARYVGRTAIWRVEPRNELLKALGVLVDAEAGLASAVRMQVRQALLKTRASRVIIFGSVARGHERSDSDLDLFVEVPKGTDKERLQAPLLRLYDQLSERFGCYVSPVVLTAAEVEKLRGSSLLEEVFLHGDVVLERDLR